MNKLLATIFTEACNIRENSYDKEGADKASAAAQKEREARPGDLYAGCVDYASFYRKDMYTAANEAATNHGQSEMTPVIYYLMTYVWNDMHSWAEDQAKAKDQKQGLPEDLMAAVEATWLSRAERQNYPKPSTKTYKDKEGEFFIGAMAAFDAAGYIMPPKWVVNIMQNKNVGEA